MVAQHYSQFEPAEKLYERFDSLLNLENHKVSEHNKNYFFTTLGEFTIFYRIINDVLFVEYIFLEEMW